MRSSEPEQLLIQGRERRHQLFALNFFREFVLLLDQTQEKETQPVRQARFVPVERSLVASQRAIVLLAVVFYHSFQRTVGHIAIACPQKNEVCQNPGEPSVAILKRMD